jgi:hypothetical protein
VRRAAGITAVAALVVVLGACTTTTSSNGTTSGGSNASSNLLHDRGAARRALAAIEREIGASPARVREVLIYPDYMIVEAQDPSLPDHIDRYTWRDGKVDPREPVHLSGPQADIAAALFPSSAVDFRAVPRIARAAERQQQRATPVRIEKARASYFDIQRSTSLDGRVTIRISIEGPRRSGRVETGSNGEILTATVD